MNKVLLLLLSIFISLIYSGCKKETNCIEGNGELLQQQREVDDFNEVSIIGSFNSTIVQGQTSSVDLFAESNIIPIIRTDVSNQQLRIIVQDGNCYNTNQDVEVYVSAPDFKRINIDGSGNVQVNNFDPDDLVIDLNGSGSLSCILGLEELTFSLDGSGDATLNGNCKNGNITISGSGNTYASTFSQETVNITVSGSGHSYLNVSKSLSVTITGSGNVYYQGNPEILEQNITGSGQLIKE